MSLGEIKDHIHDLSSAWAEFKRVNENRLAELSKNEQANSLTLEHLERLNFAMDECKNKLASIESYCSRPHWEKIPH